MIYCEDCKYITHVEGREKNFGFVCLHPEIHKMSDGLFCPPSQFFCKYATEIIGENKEKSIQGITFYTREE